jgi:ATP-dependent Clp protease ATP-binding subunit ClpB
MLNDGLLKDGQGQTVEFTNIVIILTSNVGAEHLLAGLIGEQSMDLAKEKVKQEVISSI